MTKINQVSRADAAGDTAIVKSPMTGWVLFKKDPNSTGYFSNPIQGLSTPVIQVDSAKTGKAYCIDPNTPPPGEVESPSDPGVEYDKIVMDGNDLKSKKIKLAVYIASFGDSSLDGWFTHYPQSSRWDGTADDFIIDDREISGNYPNGVDDNFKYLFIHLAVSYINHDMVFPDDFDPDSCDPTTDIECLYNTYMADVDKSLIKGIDETLTESIEDNADVWLKAQNYTLYGIDTEGENIQNVVWLEADSPQSGNIIVHKCDAELESTCDTSADAHAAQGGGSLGGITFTVYNNSGSRIYNPFDDNFYNNGDPMATATTNNSGIATFSNLPVGIDYSVRETSTNASYNLTDTTAKTVNDLTTNGAKVAFSDYVIRGDVTFKKVDENGEPIANVAFSIKSDATGEQHRVVTDSNGVVNTGNSYIPHTTGTNGYDSITGGRYIHQNYGTWFNGVDPDSGLQGAAVDNEAGALPYGSYTVTELECDANKYCDYASTSTPFSIATEHEVVDLENIVNDCAEFDISTSATDAADGDKFVEASATASITDTINYCGEAGLTYTIQGVLMDKVTGEAISIVQETTSTIPAGSDCGTATMTFNLDASELAGHDIVVFETLLYEDEEVAEHKDLNDASQTVTVISLGTTAVDTADGDKLVEASEDSQIVDTIDYCLKAGLEYTISGVLVDKATGEPITIDEETVEETITFTPSTNCGTTQMTFTLDSSELAGKAIVVYESVEYNDNTILEHQDLNDAAQTVNIISLDTYALDKSDEDKEVLATAEATITDHIKYCLVAGTEYTIIGTLMNKNTGEPIAVKDALVQSSTTLTPTENCGDLYLDFEFDATGLGGTEIVVFEAAGITSPTPLSDDDVCLEHDATDPGTCTSYFHTLISHADLDDATQTILVTTPEPEPEPAPKSSDTGRLTAVADSSGDASGSVPLVAASIVVVIAGYFGVRLFSRKRFFGKVK